MRERTEIAIRSLSASFNRQLAWRDWHVVNFFVDTLDLVDGVNFDVSSQQFWVKRETQDGQMIWL
jgi:hypothetical protein